MTQSLLPYALNLAANTAQRFTGYHYVEMDDLHAAARLGAWQAVQAFDATRGVGFRGFAITKIRGAILDELRRWDHLPRPLRDACGGEAPPWLQQPLSLDELLEEWEWEPPGLVAETEAQATRPPHWARLVAALARLPADERRIVAARYGYEWTATDIAAREGIGPRSVTRLAQRGRERLRAMLGIGE